jgi:hypothetical protein
MLAGVVLVILVALLLSGDEGREGKEGRDGQSGSAGSRASLSPSRVRLIARRVERLRELRFKKPVRPLLLTRARASRLIAELTRAEYSSRERQIDEEELKLLGLLEPSEDLGRALEAVEEEEILGFYEDRSKRLVVIREGAQPRALLEITLAHELVHALEDQHFTFHALRGLSDDAALAESALAEGTATEVMIEYAARHLEPGRLLDLALGALGPDTDLPAYVEKALLFPYEEGQEFVATFRSERGGWGALDKVLRLRHPRSSEQVLHPEKYAIDERPVRIRKADLSDVLGRGWRRLDSTTVGEVDLRALFEIVGGNAAPRAAAGWGGGHVELWRRRVPQGGECPSPCIERDVGVLRLRWDTTRDRAEAESRFPRVFERGLKARRAGPREGLGLWLSRGGAIAMAGRGRETSIVLAPNASTAARLLLSDRL